ncbi:acyltransferase family protein [Larkinella soli]|uniref:acyltransferase family protein n=1 Tax=Larkinella soli TaxID=1770527 RepID=UPI000FFC5BD9|nr:acyltransferase family protein [Larkinella soli]
MQPIVSESSLNPPSTGAPSTRRYDLDWLRVIAIVILLFYHTGMIFVSWGWHIESPNTSPALQEVMHWLHYWRMPLLFFISGAGTFFALKKRAFGTYAGERVRRLFIPLVFGMLVIVPPQIYFEWLFRGRFSGSYAEFYPNVFQFQPYEDGGRGGAFSWHHLWFVTYLFLYSLISIPVFRYLKKPAGRRLIDRLGRLIRRPGGAMWLAGFIVGNDLILGGFFPNETHALLNDWAYFMENLILFWLGYALVSRPEFWQTLTDQRRGFAFGTLACTIIFYTTLAMGDRFPALRENKVWVTFYSTNTNCLMWFSILTSVAYSFRYLNRNHRLLPHLNEAVYPFYILHQTVIVCIGYFVLKTNPGVLDGFLIISFASLFTSIALYLLFIRPFTLTRLLFGLKTDSRSTIKQPSL